jgi:hypothetical protein
MQAISRVILSHGGPDPAAAPGARPAIIATRVDAVRAADPIVASTFTSLTAHVAEVAATNHAWMTFYRGQRVDWRNRAGHTSVLPSIFRPERGKQRLSGTTLKARLTELDRAIHLLQAHWRTLRSPNPLWRFREYAVALIQHYELCPTPMVDLTTSLHVAASFARGDDGLGDGVVYVIAMPYPHETISLYPHLGLSLARLQPLVPPDALRPQFQEAWLAGRLPISAERSAGDDLAGRVIAKYALPAGAAFWDGAFQPLLQRALLPPDDPFGETLRRLVKPAEPYPDGAAPPT